MDNKFEFLLKKVPKYLYFEIVILVFIFVLIIILILWKTYDIEIIPIKIIKENDVYYGECDIEINKRIFNNKTFMMINKTKRNLNIISISETKIDYLTMKNYQTYRLQFDLKAEEKKENLLLNIKVFNNKQRMITKINKIFFKEE